MKSEKHTDKAMVESSPHRLNGGKVMCRWTGETAAVEARALRKVKGDEKVHPTSIHAIREPPQVKGESAAAVMFTGN